MNIKYKKMKNNKEINWSDITISQLLKINKIDKNIDEDEKRLHVLSIVYNKPLEEIYSQPLSVTVEMLKTIIGLENPPKKKLIKGKYEINGHKYKLFTNVSNFTTAQYIDFQILSKDYRNHLPQFLSVFFIPEDAKTYSEGYDIEAVQLDMNDLCCEDGLAVAAFF